MMKYVQEGKHRHKQVSRYGNSLGLEITGALIGRGVTGGLKGQEEGRRNGRIHTRREVQVQEGK